MSAGKPCELVAFELHASSVSNERFTSTMLVDDAIAWLNVVTLAAAPSAVAFTWPTCVATAPVAVAAAVSAATTRASFASLSVPVGIRASIVAVRVPSASSRLTDAFSTAVTAAAVVSAPPPAGRRASMLPTRVVTAVTLPSTVLTFACTVSTEAAVARPPVPAGKRASITPVRVDTAAMSCPFCVTAVCTDAIASALALPVTVSKLTCTSSRMITPAVRPWTYRTTRALTAVAGGVAQPDTRFWPHSHVPPVAVNHGM